MATPDEHGARFLRYEDIPYADELTIGSASAAARDKAARAAEAGVRRKQVTEGQVGVYTHISEFPPDFEVPRHSHDHDEMIVVLEGSCTMSDGGPELRPSDVVLLQGGLPYGFTAGGAGLRFLNIRQGLASLDMTEP